MTGFAVHCANSYPHDCQLNQPFFTKNQTVVQKVFNTISFGLNKWQNDIEANYFKQSQTRRQKQKNKSKNTVSKNEGENDKTNKVI